MSKVIALVSDLIFRSKIKEICKSYDLEPEFVRDAAELERLLTRGDLSKATFIVDLAWPRFDAVRAVSRLRQIFPDALIVTYASHIEQDRMSAAHASGASLVLAKSSFVNQLGEIVSGSSSQPL